MKQKQELVEGILRIFRQSPGNHVIPEGWERGGLRMFEEPLVGFGAAEDPLFAQYKADEKAIGPFFWTPQEWLPGASTVISLFLPFTQQVRESNQQNMEMPSLEWLYARIEGQAFIEDLMEQLRDWLEGQGVRACVPSSDRRFAVIRDQVGDSFHAESRWSERHAAYVCGLGTFGLSRGLITRKGIAGRFASVIIDAPIEPDVRPYRGTYDNCTRCGACVRRCPVRAISLEHGKNNAICSAFLDDIRIKAAPRYGCGKCQTGVPCEQRVPNRISAVN